MRRKRTSDRSGASDRTGQIFWDQVPQAIEIGRDGERFLTEKLSEPFTVVTRIGRSDGSKQIRAILWICARPKKAISASNWSQRASSILRVQSRARRRLTNSRIEVEKLQQLEDEAKRAENRSLGRERGAIECAWDKRHRLSVLLLPMERLVTLDSCGLADVILRLRNQPRRLRSPGEMNGSRAKEKTQLGNIDINTATEKELTTVPGIGHVMAARIIAARPFRSADDLKRVSGIGEKKYAQIRPYFQ